MPPRLFSLLSLLCVVFTASGQSPQSDTVQTKDKILSLLSKPENSPENTPQKTRSLATANNPSGSRSIGVAEKPQISTQAILFKFGTAEIEGDQSFAQIRELGKALEDPTMKQASIEIEGHTDNVGSAEMNQKLSEARAQKIIQVLRQHYSLSVRQLIPVGKGKSQPIAGTVDKQTDGERALNRRVVIKRLD